MDTYAERLKAAMQAAGVSVTQLAAGVGVTYQGVKKVLDGGAFGASNNAKAAAYLSVSTDWLATGNGDMRGTPTPPAQTDPEDFYWLLSQIPDPLRRIEAAHEAIAVILRVMREPAVPPTHTPSEAPNPKTRRA